MASSLAAIFGWWFFAIVIAILIILIAIIGNNIIRRLKLPDLEKKAVFITGCDSGFGHELALKCLSIGMPVFAGCLTEQGAEQLQKDAHGFKGPLRTFILDVRNEKSIAMAVKSVESSLTEDYVLHAVVNNAGIPGNTGVDDWLNVNDYIEVLDVNTLGVIRMTHAFRHLLKQSRGRVVTMLSVCSRIALPMQGTYNVSKHATRGYCSTIRPELEQFGIRVIVLEPGFFRTQMVNDERVTAVFDKVWMRNSEEKRREYGEAFLKRVKEICICFFIDTASKRTHLVVDAYFHALTAKYPKTHYPVGWDRRFIYTPYAAMPICIQQILDKIVLIVTRSPIPASMQKQKKTKREGEQIQSMFGTIEKKLKHTSDG